MGDLKHGLFLNPHVHTAAALACAMCLVALPAPHTSADTSAPGANIDCD